MAHASARIGGPAVDDAIEDQADCHEEQGEYDARIAELKPGIDREGDGLLDRGHFVVVAACARRVENDLDQADRGESARLTFARRALDPR